MGRKSWAAVRCSVCGGSGRVVVEEEAAEPQEQGSPQAKDTAPDTKT